MKTEQKYLRQETSVSLRPDERVAQEAFLQIRQLSTKGKKRKRKTRKKKQNKKKKKPSPHQTRALIMGGFHTPRRPPQLTEVTDGRCLVFTACRGNGCGRDWPAKKVSNQAKHGKKCSLQCQARARGAVPANGAGDSRSSPGPAPHPAPGESNDREQQEETPCHGHEVIYRKPTKEKNIPLCFLLTSSLS